MTCQKSRLARNPRILSSTTRNPSLTNRNSKNRGKTRNSRSADASGGFGSDGGERKLADGNRSTVIGGETSGSDAAASCADGEEVKVVVDSDRLGSVLRFGAHGEGAAARENWN